MLLPMGRRKLSEVAVEQIKSLIESGAIQPGDKLPTERELTRQLQVSRSSVREALRTVEALGLIEISPGRGTYVRNRSDEEGYGKDAVALSPVQSSVEDLLEVRTIIETKACVLAAQRATAEDIEAMQAAIEETLRSIAANDLTRIALADMAFHHAITRATKNALLIRLEAAIAQQLMEHRRASLGEEGVPHLSLRRHQIILEAIKARDGDWAAGIMLDGLKRLEARLRAVKQHEAAAGEAG